MLHLHVPQQLEARERGTQSRTRDAKALGEDSLWGKTQAFRGCRHEGPHGVPRLVACGWPTPRRLVDWSDHLATLYIGSQRVNGLGASVEIERRAPGSCSRIHRLSTDLGTIGAAATTHIRSVRGQRRCSPKTTRTMYMCVSDIRFDKSYYQIPTTKWRSSLLTALVGG